MTINLTELAKSSPFLESLAPARATQRRLGLDAGAASAPRKFVSFDAGGGAGVVGSPVGANGGVGASEGADGADGAGGVLARLIISKSALYLLDPVAATRRRSDGASSFGHCSKEVAVQSMPGGSRARRSFNLNAAAGQQQQQQAMQVRRSSLSLSMSSGNGGMAAAAVDAADRDFAVESARKSMLGTSASSGVGASAGHGKTGSQALHVARNGDILVWIDLQVFKHD